MTIRCFSRLALIATLAAFATCSTAAADILFSEDFDGYTSFPAQIPSGDYVNPGLPLQSEGADEFWFGGRFESGGGSIDSDLAVQKIGGGTNSTRCGRFEDDAGLLFNISTIGLDTAALSFDWRTFLAETTDRLKVGYYIGNLNFGSDRYEDFYANFGASWWDNNWTQLLSASSSNSWHNETFALPLNQPSVWVAFWLDNGEGDYAKIDNIVVLGSHPIPEPSSVLLAAMGAALCGVLASRHRRRSRGV